jgi:hypothetical protein
MRNALPAGSARDTGNKFVECRIRGHLRTGLIHSVLEVATAFLPVVYSLAAPAGTAFFALFRGVLAVAFSAA